MQAHIKQTVNDLEDRLLNLQATIVSLQSTIAALKTFDAMTAQPAETKPAGSRTNGAAPAKLPHYIASMARSRPKRCRNKPGGQFAIKPGTTLARFLNLLSTLTGEINVKDLPVQASLTMPMVRAYVHQIAQNGWLISVGRGKYQKTKLFPRAGAWREEVLSKEPTPSAECARKPAARAEELSTRFDPVIDPKSKEARLELALRQRDSARSRGNETAAGIYQDEITAIEAEA